MTGKGLYCPVRRLSALSSGGIEAQGVAIDSHCGGRHLEREVYTGKGRLVYYAFPLSLKAHGVGPGREIELVKHPLYCGLDCLDINVAKWELDLEGVGWNGSS